MSHPEAQSAEHAAVERSSTTRKNAPKVNDASPRRAPKGKRLCIHLPTAAKAVAQVEFGTFKGDNIYRNRIGPNEKANDGHYSIEELIPDGCTSALCTTMEGSSTKWLQQVFGNIPSLLVVTSGSPTIGNAVVSPMCYPQLSTDDENNNANEKEAIPIPNWFWLLCRPHTGGCLHSKLLLFRSKQGLRLIISGNNLSKYQWEGQRDVFWAQDFPLAGYKKAQPETGTFGRELYDVLKAMTKCAKENDNALVNSRIGDVFADIEFKTFAQLVVSFPRQKGSKKERKWDGWKMLADAVTSRLRDCGMLEDYDSEDSECSGPRANNPAKPRVVYATSGSFGDLEPDFILQMYEAMNGNNMTKVSKSTSWEEVHDLVRCFWPGKATACTMDLMGLVGALRSMPQNKLDKIPKESFRKVFHDAIPNPPTKVPSRLMGDNQQEFHATTHGKFIGNNRGVLYVGSHNFSKAAWGLRDAQPKNVEIGVVIATPSEEKWKKWRSRLPCQLVPPQHISPAAYSPYTRYSDIENGHPEAQNQLIRQVIRLYQQAEEVGGRDHSFFQHVPLDSVLQWSTDAKKTFLDDYRPKVKRAMERKAKAVSGVYFASSDSDSD